MPELITPEGTAPESTPEPEKAPPDPLELMTAKFEEARDTRQAAKLRAEVAEAEVAKLTKASADRAKKAGVDSVEAFDTFLGEFQEKQRADESEVQRRKREHDEAVRAHLATSTELDTVKAERDAFRDKERRATAVQAIGQELVNQGADPGKATAAAGSLLFEYAPTWGDEGFTFAAGETPVVVKAWLDQSGNRETFAPTGTKGKTPDVPPNGAPPDGTQVAQQGTWTRGRP